MIRYSKVYNYNTYAGYLGVPGEVVDFKMQIIREKEKSEYIKTSNFQL